MTTLTSKDAKNRFGDLLITAQREPVTITRNDKPVAVVVSKERYEQLEALEDEFWALRAKEAAKGGFLSPEDSEKLLEDILNA